jgi:hypothetical protein
MSSLLLSCVVLFCGDQLRYEHKIWGMVRDDESALVRGASLWRRADYGEGPAVLESWELVAGLKLHRRADGSVVFYVDHYFGAEVISDTRGGKR